MAEYASKGVAGSGLGLGIAGTALALLGNNGLNGLFGGSNLQAENAMLKAENYSDKTAKEVYAQAIADNKALREELYAFIKPISEEVAKNQTEVAVLKAVAEKDKEITSLKIDNCCCQMNSKIDTVAQSAATGIANLTNIVSNITKIVVPKTAICPEVMPRYNSWTAPTSTETA